LGVADPVHSLVRALLVPAAEDVVPPAAAEAVENEPGKKLPALLAWHRPVGRRFYPVPLAEPQALAAPLARPAPSPARAATRPDHHPRVDPPLRC
jgi:hypothetical protein